MELYRLITTPLATLDPTASSTETAPCSDSVPSSQPITRQYLDSQGMKIISAEKFWGLLPSQMSRVQEVIMTELQLLKVIEQSFIYKNLGFWELYL